MIKIPEKTYAGTLPPLTDEQLPLRDKLVHDVGKLAGQIGEENPYNPATTQRLNSV